MASKKKQVTPPAGPRRKHGLVMVRVREGSNVDGARLFTADTIGEAHGHTGSTPREALQRLEDELGELTIPADDKSVKLLRTPFKAPGQDPGGPPVKRDQPATASLSVRIPPNLKRRAQERAVALGVSPAQFVLDAIEAHLGNLARTRRISKRPAEATE